MLADVAAVAASRGADGQQHKQQLHQQAVGGGGGVALADVKECAKRATKRVAVAIGAPTVPSVRWDDIGGLEDVKARETAHACTHARIHARTPHQQKFMNLHLWRARQLYRKS